jgi:hypothetical protein
MQGMEEFERKTKQMLQNQGLRELVLSLGHQ